MDPGFMDNLEVALTVQRTVEPKFKRIQSAGTFPYIMNLIGRVNFHKRKYCSPLFFNYCALKQTCIC
jgi:hypothetical protein